MLQSSLIVLTPSFSPVLFLVSPCYTILHNIILGGYIIANNTSGNHVHSIVGSNAFKANVTYDDLQSDTTCSTVFVKPDKSIYWLPSLYFQDPKNGSFARVPERPEHKIYYMNRLGKNETMNEFPKGFQMIAGDATLRAPAATKQLQQVTQWYCHSPDKVGSGFPAGITGCGFGFAGSIHFPHCWNGQAFDINNPTAHMSYPMGDHPDSGYCPPSHPHGMPHIFIEFWFDTKNFDGMYTGSDNPWVLANGDPTGYGFHADFINGWDAGVLQKAMTTCTIGESGRPLSDCFDMYTSDERNKCAIQPQVKENIDGWLDQLPGCNPVQSGPAAATATPACDANNKAVAAPAATKAPTSGQSGQAAASSSVATYSFTKTSYKSTTAAAQADVAAATPATPSQVKAPVAAASSSPAANAPAAADSAANAPAAAAPASNSKTSLPFGWTDAGCYSDTVNPRSLQGINLANVGAPMTTSACASYCAAAGYSIAGTEYGTQCFCGNQLIGSQKIDESVCNMPCKGDSSDMCGGASALSVYKASSASLTTNSKVEVSSGSGGSKSHSSSWKPRRASM